MPIRAAPAGAGRSTRRWRVIKTAFRSRCAAAGAPCWLCGQPIDYEIDDHTDDGAFEPDHLYPVSTHPERAEDPDNLRPSHRGCNRRRGNKLTPTSLGSLSRNWFG